MLSCALNLKLVPYTKDQGYTGNPLFTAILAFRDPTYYHRRHRPSRFLKWELMRARWVRKSSFMTTQEAKLILQAYRLGGEDEDPLFSKALDLTLVDQSLENWFNE